MGGRSGIRLAIRPAIAAAMRGRRGTHQARPDQGVAVLQGDLARGVRRRRSTARGHGDQAPTIAGPAGEAGGKESERREPQGAPRASDKAQAVTDEESGQGSNRRSWPLNFNARGRISFASPDRSKLMDWQE